MIVSIEKGLAEQSAAKEIRKEVFIDEQGFENEFDAIDERAVHVVLEIDGEPAATGRMYQKEHEDKVAIAGRIAVRSKYRKLHLGKRVMEELEACAKKQGNNIMELSAQVRVQGFYQKLGYEPVGEEYYDEYCPHILMRKNLTKD